MRSGVLFGAMVIFGAVAMATPAAAQADPCTELGQYIDPNGDDLWTAPPSNAAALDAANRCIAARGGTANLYGIRAYIHRLMGNYSLADADATRRIEIDKSGNAYRNRAIIRQTAGQHEQAVADFRESLRRGFNRPAWVHRELAASLRQLDRFSEALAAVDTSVALDPTYDEALYERGLIFFEQERWDEAIGAFTRYIALNGSNAQAYVYRSTSFIRLERWNDALADAERAIQINPRSANGFNNRGYALHNLGRYGESIAAFRRSTQLEPENSSAWDNLCSYLTDANDPAGALVACDRRESLPGVTGEDRARVSSFRGLAHEALGETPNAIRAFRAALSNPDAHAVTRARAEAGLLRLGFRN
ncbi:tetratricopeptide repeat protein [Brevundimonas bacteroides]|uniref:tetratricopeptide repeat protein n=1 Tax=Brevundimonas bacteroides TaxID=74311 RepID=UPI000A0152F9|nr:tetratricopeptide repeat protein [Brevundimonas bacteroides]